MPPEEPGSPPRPRHPAAAAFPDLLLLGIDHRGVPLELRERVAYGAAEAEQKLVHLLARPGVGEALLLSTCNRTEVVLQPRDEEDAYRSALELVFLARAPELERPGMLYVKRHADAARHVMAVASGLESMVLGEPEILGQVKQAATLAEAVGAAGPVLRRLLRSALAAGGRARQETAITQGAVSFGYAVVELGRNIFRDLDACQVLLIGAGDIARSVARALGERGATRLAVANRGAARAQEFHQEFPHAALLDFDQRLPALAAADLVIVSTGAGEPVVTRADLAGAMAGRRTRPLLVVDLGVPRNVEAAAGRLENVFLHTIDSLDHLIQRNLKRRKEEVPRVEEIVEQELGRFQGWFRGIQAEPLVARLQKQAEQIRRAELAQALPHFPAGTHEHLDRLTRSLVRKILHYPSSRLRGRDGAEDLPRLDLVRELFQLDEEAEAAEAEALTAAAGGSRERPGELPQPPADAAMDPAPEARRDGEPRGAANGTATDSAGGGSEPRGRLPDR